ncbi:MAG TPA: super-infection exclusion protein B [Mucilaginibacter sp.]
MEKFLEKLFDLKRIPTKLLFVICLSSGLILFVPERFLVKLNLQDFLKDYGKYIGISFIVSSAFLVIALISYVLSQLSIKTHRKKIRKRILRDIQYLDIHEKALLREFFINKKQTLQMPMDNETVIGLLNKDIIYQASGTGFTQLRSIYFSYSLTKIARENLTLQLIDLPQNPAEEDIRKIIENRPAWAKEKTKWDNMYNSGW